MEENKEDISLVKPDGIDQAPSQILMPSCSIGDIDKLLLQTINLNSSQILHEPTCPICSSPFRKQIEEKWLETKKFEDIKAILKEKNIEKITNSVIENHIYYHASSELREIKKIEYANKIERLNNCNLTTLERIKLCLSALTERLMGINSIIPSGDIGVSEIEKIKSAETSRLMGAYNNLLKLQANILGEMRNSGELITIPRKDFVNIFNEAIMYAKSQESRLAIKNILDRLAKISGDFGG